MVRCPSRGSENIKLQRYLFLAKVITEIKFRYLKQSFIQKEMLKYIGAGLLGLGYAGYHYSYYVDSGFVALAGKEHKHHGLHFRMPWEKSPNILEINSKRYVFQQKYINGDRMVDEVEFEIFVQPELDRLYDIFLTYGEEYNEKVIPPIFKELIDKYFTRFDTKEDVLETYRRKEKVKKELTEKLKEVGIKVLDLKYINHF